ALAALALDTANRNPFRLTAPADTACRPGDSPVPIPAAAPTNGRPLGERIKSKVRGWLINGLNKLRPLPSTGAVHIARAETYDAPLTDILAKQFEHFRQHVAMAGKRVVLKPNLVEYRREKVINTDPRVIDAVIQLCKKEGASEVVVAE